MFLPFSEENKKKYYAKLDEIFESSMWSEGEKLREFEAKFSEFCGIPSRAINNGGSGLLAILDYLDVTGHEVVVPTNTFWATTQAVRKSGGHPVFADVSKMDLCLSLEALEKVVTSKTKAVMLVHIGGHLAFDSFEIAEYCKKNNLFLIEDCAHAHGATWRGKTAGDFGFAGSYSFYATKTMPTGDGGMVVSHDKDFLSWVEKYRNYGKEVVNGVVTYPITSGFNYRMSDFIAALGIVQLEEMPKILDWKRSLAAKFDEIFPAEARVQFPKGMVSGYYKYIVFEQQLSQKTGQVFGPLDLNHRIAGQEDLFPTAQWLSENHQCAPIWYGWPEARKDSRELKDLLFS